MIKMRKTKDGVYFPDEEVVSMSASDFRELKNLVLKSPSGRAMVCLHQNENDDVHELLIVMTKDVYNAPHRHNNKGESLHFIEGMAELYLFDKDGSVKQMLPVGDKTTGRASYYRISGDDYHALSVVSDVVIFHETTKGPFDKGNKMNAPWAPDEKNREEGLKFMSSLKSLYSLES